VGWIHERVMEVSVLEQQVEPQEARQQGMEHAKAEITAAAGKDARVVNEKILHEKTENGKVYMEVLLEVEESIALELPVVPAF
jgi:similar to stage IV sporulation protein